MKKSTIIEIIIIALLVIALVIIFILFSKRTSNNNIGSWQNNSQMTQPGEQVGGGGEQTSNVTTSGATTITDTQSLTNATLTTSEADVSTVIAENGGNATISNSVISKTGNTSNTSNSEFYGLNAGALAKANSSITITDSSISTSGNGANAAFATGSDSNITLKNVKIATTGNSSRGLDATYGGTINADSVDINTEGAHCAAVATDRGEGTITVTNSELNTAGEGSPCIYSTGSISVSNSIGKSTGSSISVIEGKNSIILNNDTLEASGLGRATGGIDNCGVMIYQSMSGDAGTGVGTFTANDSKLSILSDSSVYTTAPMFFSTNTNSIINLKNTELSFGSGKLLVASGNTGEWGAAGSNGANVIFNAEDEKLEGDISADNISTISITLKNSTLKGTINGDNSAKSVTISLDSSSKWTVTGTSYITSITDDDKTLSNIISNGNTIYYDSTNSENSWLNGKTIELEDGGILKPVE